MATFDRNGYEEDELSDIILYLQDGLKAIYGNDLNFDSDSILGQQVNIMAQIIKDSETDISTLINNLDPDEAIGKALDTIIALSGVSPRKAGSFTLQNVDVVVDQNVNLEGLDSNINNLNGTGFTVTDDQGRKFILASSVSLTAGTHTLSFRAEKIGAINTTANTITNIDTIVLGVVSVNNPNTASSIGNEFELDSVLRNRRESSLEIRATDWALGLQGALLELQGVSEALVLDNDQNTVDSNGQSGNSIWCIVEGETDQNVADLIFLRKTAGISTFNGNISTSVSQEVVNSAGTVKVIKFDRPVAKTLYIKFDVKKKQANSTIDEAGVKQYIVENLIFKIAGSVDSTTALLIANEAVNNNSGSGGAIPLDLQLSKDNVSFSDSLDVDFVYEKWNLSAGNININIL